MPDAPLRRAAGPAIAYWLTLSCAFMLGCAAPLAVVAAPVPPSNSAPTIVAESAASVTFHVRATREGLVGGVTSSGHIITANDHFVALPCTCALNKNVRLSFNGKSQVVPVYDIGPWNNKDDYWMPSDVRTFKGLPRGVPQATAAFTDKINGGRSGMGDVVTNPTGVDIGDGTWYELGLTDSVDITFLWLTDDPTGGGSAPKSPAAPPPPPAPAAKSASVPSAKGGFDVKNLPVMGVSDAPPLDNADPIGTGFTYISQTKHNVPDVIAKYWKDKGGVPMFGYPLSEVFVRKANGETHVYQYFERVLFEYLPDSNGVALAPLGSWFGEVNGPYDTVDPFDSTAKKRYVAATQHSIGGGILQWYAANGDADMFGAPISEELPYTTPDGRKVTAQLFERGRIEMDASGAVTLGRLGAEWLSQRGWM